MILINRTGPRGALLDIYEQALSDLKKTIEKIRDEDLLIITDSNTPDENCRSIQTILTHVVHSGYGYATYIHNLTGPHRERPAKTSGLTVNEFSRDLDEMFLYTEEVFSRIKDEDAEQNNNEHKIMTGWGQQYDIEQLTEHAIVHVLRHRRQIERIKLSFNF